MSTIEQITNVLKSLARDDKEVFAVAIWTEDDVISQAMENWSMKITREEAQEILRNIEENHDASLGITWDTINAYLAELKTSDEKDRTRCDHYV